MIDTKAIRTKILDLAMRGKLTEQLPEDGTAEDLYQQIQAEKQALIKAGKLKKEKPLAEIMESENDFDIPENWRWVSIGSVCINIQYGSSKKSSSFGKMVVLRMGNIQAGRVVYDELVYTSDDDEIEKYPLEKDDLLFNRTNSMELVGKTAIYKGEIPAIYAGYLVRLTPLVIVSEYLNYVMQSKYYWDYCRTVRIDSNGQSNINAEKLKRFVFPLPPLAEQQRIVERIEQAFSALDTIDTLQAQYADNLTLLKSKLIDAAIQGKLTEQLPEDGTAEELYQQIQTEKQALIKAGKIKKEKPLPEISADEIPFEIPFNWKWVALGNLTSKITSGSTPNGGRKSAAYVPNGFPFFREQNIYDDGIHEAGMVYISEKLLNSRQNSMVLANDILLNITGGSIGRCALVSDNFDRGSINQHILILRAVNQETRYFIHRLICSPYIQNYIKNKAVGDKDGFSGGRCKRMLVPLPPIAEQKRIVEKLDKILRLL